MIIRRTECHDIPSIQHLNTSILPENYTQEYLLIHHILNPTTNYVAVHDKQVVGYLLGTKKGVLISICVARAYRGRGIGTLLVRALLADVCTVCLCVRVHNYSAIRLYVHTFGGVVRCLLKRYYENGDDAYLIRISRE